MFKSIWSAVKLIAQPLISVYLIPYLLKKVIITKTDQRRYDLIAAISFEVASDLVQRYPDKEWDDLFKAVVVQVRDGVPTSNEEVIYRAAANALRTALRLYRGEDPPQQG